METGCRIEFGMTDQAVDLPGRSISPGVARGRMVLYDAAYWSSHTFFSRTELVGWSLKFMTFF
jgi:hypothetical protein